MPVLWVAEGPDRGRSFRVDAICRVGRERDVDALLADERVSRVHIVVEPEGDDWFLRDLGSRNGTTLNGRRVGRARLADGDHIGLGGTLLIFHLSERTAPSAAAPPPPPPPPPPSDLPVPPTRDPEAPPPRSGPHPVAASDAHPASSPSVATPPPGGPAAADVLLAAIEVMAFAAFLVALSLATSDLTHALIARLR